MPTRPIVRQPAPRRRGRRRGAVRAAVAAASALVLLVTGVVWNRYSDLSSGLHRSSVLSTASDPSGRDTNILVMGLDSRLDENGNPLPAAVYDAMHTGGSDVGGYNTNVLILLHVPGDGSRATAMSIPRDDYVSLAGSPDGQSKGKIKQAYGLAFDQEHRQLVAQGVTDPATLEQRSRDAGRSAEIATVRQFLGGVPINHFVEVTMVAFYELAQVVAPITVCLDENTRDSYSGADFHQGYQQLDAAQALAFVRQRRDTAHPSLNFTDLDRERRQQAFIASLAYQLKQAGTLTDPAKLQGLIDVAKQNIAVDDGLDLLQFAQQASGLANGDVTFTTLPIARFGTDSAGEDVNIVDVAQVQVTVARLLGPAPAAAPPAALGAVDVRNATGRAGLAATVSRTLTADGYTAGTTGNAVRSTSTVVHYPAGAATAAAALAGTLGTSHTELDSVLPAGHLEVVLGTGFTLPAASAPTSAPAAPGDALGSISGGGIPCVK
jgi:LCP family protein required for cell wall assembly